MKVIRAIFFTIVAIAGGLAAGAILGAITLGAFILMIRDSISGFFAGRRS